MRDVDLYNNALILYNNALILYLKLYILASVQYEPRS